MRFFSISLCLILAQASLLACGPFDCLPPSVNTQVIAHRGFWKAEGAAQNSIKALQAAQQAGIYGAEFDIWITADGVAVINHDPHIGGKEIALTNYDDIKDCTLSNGERLPLLQEYLETGKADPNCKLILEIKPHPSKEMEDRAVEIVANMVAEMDLEAQSEYISFSLYFCKALRARLPQAIITYLNGELSPAEVKAAGLSGLDYNYTVFRNYPHWVKEAQDLGLSVNTWTVNNEALMREMLALGVDFITTDEPLLLKDLITRINQP